MLVLNGYREAMRLLSECTFGGVKPIGGEMSSAVDFLSSLSEKGSGVPRILLFVAHPDDEVIGAGGILRYMRGAHIFHVTDGSPRSCTDVFGAGCASREAYARVRREELLPALKYAGFGPS